MAFRDQVRPILQQYCFDCHADGANKGNVAFDELNSDQALLDNHALWFKALKNLRAGLMPPPRKPQPTPEEKLQIERWIKSAVFKADPQNPDPGRVTVRRLNRVEYRNTIRDLTGIDYDTAEEFPADDAGFGFDTIGDALTLSPMLIEKYFAAAQTIVGKAVPIEPSHTGKYERFFAKGPPEDELGRRRFAADVLTRFAEQAFRRPAAQGTIDRLVALAESVYSQPGNTFEAGVSQAFIAILASPRFLFREEGLESAAASSGDAGYAKVDEFALASRLSYFLWSTMPDEHLFRLARAGELRRNLAGEMDRMLADKKAEALVRNFVGQWLQVRDVEHVEIDARQVLARDSGADPDQDRRRKRSRQLREKQDAGELSAEEKKELDELRAAFARRSNQAPSTELTGELRRAMRLETEKTFEYVLRQDRTLLELLDSDYTFLNERLANHYGLTNLNVTGNEMRLVTLPAESPRGGILTQGTVLAVTSNPTRTSPVKRGLFVLDNLLGVPPAPPPPDIPALEEAAKGITDRPVTLRETLALHREKALCSSCHDRMDPLGLALENFNAMGMWRDQERGQPIDATGKLLTGETFANVKELKHILAKDHATEFYRTLTEKLLTYALGRGLEYYDVVTVDAIVERLEKEGGRPSALFAGIIESAPFQKTRVGRGDHLAQQTPARPPL